MLLRAGIVLDAESGEILASSSQPGYDANALMNTGRSGTRRQCAILNRVMQGSNRLAVFDSIPADEDQWQDFLQWTSTF